MKRAFHEPSAAAASARIRASALLLSLAFASAHCLKARESPAFFQ
jgi:hypothetical protein